MSLECLLARTVYRLVEGMKTFVIYWSYTITLSTAFVLVNVFISLVTSDFIELGYGKVSCYISSEKMIVFTFGAPIGLVVITNMVMFGSVIRKIINMPKIQKDVRHERNDLVIFAKLSSLTGLSWIFGFVYLWTDIQAFSYLFISIECITRSFPFPIVCLYWTCA